jgi:hypothetical protein
MSIPLSKALRLCPLRRRFCDVSFGLIQCVWLLLASGLSFVVDVGCCFSYLKVIGLVIGVVRILSLWRVGYKSFRGLVIGVVGILSLWRVCVSLDFTDCVRLAPSYIINKI